MVGHLEYDPADRLRFQSTFWSNITTKADENVLSARARALSISENVLYDHGDLQQVQAEALMALFFFIQSQINRSWKMIGIAARSGIALGLNLEKKIIRLDIRSGEARKQLWWSIFRSKVFSQS